MGVFATMQAEKRAQSFDPLRPRDPALARLFGFRKALSGVEVDEDSALSTTAMFAGVRFLAENMASVPLKLYRRDGRGKEALRDDPRWWMLQSDPNPEQTSMELREMTVGFIATNGNGYVEIVEGSDGIAQEFWPIVPWRIRQARAESGRLTYMVRRPGDEKEVPIPPERIMHFRGFSRNGVLGDDVVERMREALGLTIAAERSAAAFFGNGAQPSGVLKTDSILSDKAFERLKKERDAMHGGVENWHRLAILEEGVTWQQLSTDPEKAQLIETRKFQVTEVARILNLPPHVLKDLERSTFSNIEHQGLELVTYSLRPWAVRLEQVYEKRLLLPRERRTHVIRHNLEGFLRGDMAGRFQAYATGRQWGWYSANDVREKEDENPIGPEGDIYMAPINMLPADQFATVGLARQQVQEPVEQERAERRSIEQRDAAKGRAAMLRKRTEASFRPVFAQRMEGLVRREANAIRRALTKAAAGGGVQEFRIWLETFYEDNGAYVGADMLPAFASLATAIYAQASDEVGVTEDRDLAEWVRGWSERYGAEHAGSSLAQVSDILREQPLFEDAKTAVEERLVGWEETRAGKVALAETVAMGAKVALLAYGVAGIMMKQWWANPDSCPLCRQMHGRTVSLSAPFLTPGEEVDPGDQHTTPLRAERNYSVPQLHGGCNCSVVPG